MANEKMRREQLEELIGNMKSDLNKIEELLLDKEENPKYTEMQEKLAIGKILKMCNISEKKQCFLMFTETIYRYSKLHAQQQSKKGLTEIYKGIAMKFKTDQKTVNLLMKNELRDGSVFNSKTSKIFRNQPNSLWEFVRDITKFYIENKEYYIGCGKTIADINKLLNKLLKEDEISMPKWKKLKQTPLEMEKTIDRYLVELGAYEHLVGYNALKQAIVIYLCNPNLPNIEYVYTEVSVKQNVPIVKVSNDIKRILNHIKSYDEEQFDELSVTKLINKIASRYLDEYYVI